MGKYFGTDGFRGEANVTLTADHAYQVGRFLGWYCGETKRRAGDETPVRVVIGKDTRQSGDMLEAALTAGLCSVGADVESLGVLPTPAVAYLVGKYNADAGIVISASHNPMEFNGIKIFAGTGYKLPDEVENQIEAYIDNDCAGIELKTGAEVGRVSRRDDGLQDYVDHLYESVNGDLTGLNVCIDCANGASAAVAQKLFPRLGAKCTFIGIQPDGQNINKGVGSTHLDNLEKAVVEGGFDCGIAFDGDADRCLACDEQGREMDGDKIIALLAMTMKDKGRLDGDTAVVTVMSNLGFIKFMECQGIHTEKTAVGDKYVAENMRQNGHLIGGEQSGHVINREFATTGDGTLTALTLCNEVVKSGKSLKELAADFPQLPQTLINVPNVDKMAAKTNAKVQAAVEREEKLLGDTGRVLLRPSGTEPLVRVMAEAETQQQADEVCDRLAKVVADELTL